MTRGLFAFVVVGSFACGGGGSLPTGPTPVTARVEFRAEAMEAEGSPTFCSGPVSLHPSFWGFAQVTMAPVASDAWAAVVEEVPVGRHSATVRASEGCFALELFANGVPVTEEFIVHPDGSVTP